MTQVLHKLLSLGMIGRQTNRIVENSLRNNFEVSEGDVPGLSLLKSEVTGGCQRQSIRKNLVGKFLRFFVRIECLGVFSSGFRSEPDDRCQTPGDTSVQGDTNVYTDEAKSQHSQK